ncbi:purine-nucleoside phosphorylase [Actinomycetospora lemnae]|uniref:Purine nucleoside phosphorylase n=1 Tax=Actinomycetospora lemnae TaxID=3019891 RepID=A0ABT5SLX7_9PSEU|nr:purine-nucleoside phosphorylase [Actinomycetospora sp. DW7H6]MDD7963835.1 purine-nucleoside phosphorylase [Actinomycetospora sp. DW7H6]
MTVVEPPFSPPPTPEAAAAELAKRTGALTHDVAVVLGSGWRPAADAFGEPAAEVPVADLPGFTPPGAPDHAGVARSVEVAGHRVLVLLGRIHLYEGYGPAQVVHPVRTARAAGARTIVLTNAAGGIDPSYGVGQAVLVSDHLNLTATSPLAGPDFVDLTDAYDPGLRALARTIDPDLPEGVYAGLRGPHFETPAEIRMLRTMGADLVGMSTVLETIAARALGARVAGVALVSNPAAGTTDAPIDHLSVIEAVHASAARTGALLRRLVEAALETQETPGS